MRPLAARRSVGARRWRAGDGRRGVLHRGPRGAARSGGGAVPTARESASLRRRLRQPSTMEPGHDQAPTMMTREAEAAQNNSNRNQRNHDHAPLSSLSPSTILHHRRRPVVVNVEQFQRIVQGRGNQVKPRACRRGGKAVEQRTPPARHPPLQPHHKVSVRPPSPVRWRGRRLLEQRHARGVDGPQERGVVQPAPLGDSLRVARELFVAQGVVWKGRRGGTVGAARQGAARRVRPLSLFLSHPPCSRSPYPSPSGPNRGSHTPAVHAMSGRGPRPATEGGRCASLPAKVVSTEPPSTITVPPPEKRRMSGTPARRAAGAWTRSAGLLRSERGEGNRVGRHALSRSPHPFSSPSIHNNPLLPTLRCPARWRAPRRRRARTATPRPTPSTAPRPGAVR